MPASSSTPHTPAPQPLAPKYPGTCSPPRLGPSSNTSLVTVLTGKKLGKRETQSAGVLRINGAARGNIQLFTGEAVGNPLTQQPRSGGSWFTGQRSQSWCAQPAARVSPPGSGLWARLSWEESTAQWAPPVPRAFVHVSPFTTHSLGDVDTRAPFYRCDSEAQQLCSLPEVPSWPCVGTVYCTTFLLRLLLWPVPSSQGPAHFLIGQLHHSHLLASHSTPLSSSFPSVALSSATLLLPWLSTASLARPRDWCPPLRPPPTRPR